MLATLAGTPHRPENLRRRILVPAVKAAGLEDVGFHTLRHTAASAWISRGATLVQVQRLLGHTLRRSRWRPTSTCSARTTCPTGNCWRTW